ncbi:hypothetical protein D3C87_1473170 [compost metagenome]
MAHAVEEAVDLAIADRRAVLVRAQFRRQRKVLHRPAHRGQQFFHRRARARTRVADVEALALQVFKGLDIRVLARHDRERFGVDRKYRAQLGERAGLLELPFAVVGVETDVGLHDAQIKFAGLDGVGVEDRSPGGFNRTTDAMRSPVLVHQAADGAARGVVDARDASRADTDELLLGGGGCRRRGQQRRGKARRGERPGVAMAQWVFDGRGHANSLWGFSP